MGDQAGAEELVFLVAAWEGARGACHRAGWGEGLARAELFACEVEFDAVREAVPPVVAVRGAVPADVRDQEVAAEQVVDDHGRDVAVAHGRVVGAPVGQVVG